MNRFTQSLLASLLLTALAGPAHAALTLTLTLTVNSVADTVDANPGDGVCKDAMVSARCARR